MSTFRQALNMKQHSPLVNGNTVRWPCGLEIVLRSVLNRTVSQEFLAAFQAAHRQHHEAGHNPTASLYYSSDGDAWCSCLHDKETGRRRV